MKNILIKLKDGLLVGAGIICIVGIANAWTGLQAETGDTLTSAKWNELVNTPKGLVVDYVISENTSQLNLSNTTPWDNTIPQISEGNQIFNLNITPKNIGNHLVFEGVINWVEPSNHSDHFVAALYKDGASNAVATSVGSASGDTQCSTGYPVICSFPIRFSLSSDSISSTNYTLRIGLNGGNIYLNQAANGGKMGGTLKSFLSITEITN